MNNRGNMFRQSFAEGGDAGARRKRDRLPEKEGLDNATFWSVAGDIGKWGLNQLVSPIETIVGRDFYDPKFSNTGFGGSMGNIDDITGGTIKGITNFATNVPVISQIKGGIQSGVNKLDPQGKLNMYEGRSGLEDWNKSDWKNLGQNVLGSDIMGAFKKGKMSVDNTQNQTVFPGMGGGTPTMQGGQSIPSFNQGSQFGYDFSGYFSGFPQSQGFPNWSNSAGFNSMPNYLFKTTRQDGGTVRETYKDKGLVDNDSSGEVNMMDIWTIMYPGQDFPSMSDYTTTSEYVDYLEKMMTSGYSSMDDAQKKTLQQFINTGVMPTKSNTLLDGDKSLAGNITTTGNTFTYNDNIYNLKTGEKREGLSTNTSPLMDLGMGPDTEEDSNPYEGVDLFKKSDTGLDKYIENRESKEDGSLDRLASMYSDILGYEYKIPSRTERDPSLGKTVAKDGMLVKYDNGGGVNTLYDYYTSLGQSLPSVQDRSQIFTDAGLGSNYAGTAEQNQLLLSHLQQGSNTIDPTIVTSNTTTNTTTGNTTIPNTNQPFFSMFRQINTSGSSGFNPMVSQYKSPNEGMLSNALGMTNIPGADKIIPTATNLLEDAGSIYGAAVKDDPQMINLKNKKINQLTLGDEARDRTINIGMDRNIMTGDDLAFQDQQKQMADRQTLAQFKKSRYEKVGDGLEQLGNVLGNAPTKYANTLLGKQAGQLGIAQGKFNEKIGLDNLMEGDNLKHLQNFSNIMGGTTAARGMLVKKQEQDQKRKENIQKILWDNQ